MQWIHIADDKLIQECTIYIMITKTKTTVYIVSDLNEVMVGAVSASCSKSFHI